MIRHGPRGVLPPTAVDLDDPFGHSGDEGGDGLFAPEDLQDSTSEGAPGDDNDLPDLDFVSVADDLEDDDAS